MNALTKTMQGCLCVLLLTPIISHSFLAWGQVLRLLCIWMGLLYLFWRYKNAPELDYKAFIGIGFLLCVFVVIQFDPAAVREDQPFFNSHFILSSLLLLVALILGIVHWFLLPVSQRRAFLRPEGLEVYDFRILLIAGLFLIFHIPNFFSWFQGDTFPSVFVRLPQILLIYFLVSRLYVIFKYSFRSTMLKFASGSLAIVLLLSAWQLFHLWHLYEDAEQSLINRNWTNSVSSYNELIKQNEQTFQLSSFDFGGISNRLNGFLSPESVEKNYVLGQIAYAQGLNDDASKYLNKVIQQRPDPQSIPLAVCYNHYHRILMDQASWPQLLASAKIGLQYLPNDLLLKVHLGIGSLKQHQFVPAKHFLSAVLQDIDLSLPEGHIGTIRNVLPDALHSFVSYLALLEMVAVGREMGVEIVYPNETIGQTGVVTPVSISAKSAGYGYGSAHVYISGKDVLADFGSGRGYNLVVINPQTGAIEEYATFDVSNINPEEGNRMLAFVEALSPGKIVVAVVSDNASNLPKSGLEALQKIGALGDIRDKARWGHAVIGVKGAKPGDAVELLGRASQLDVSVISGNMNVGEADVVAAVRETAQKTGKSVLYLTGTRLDDKIMWVQSR